VIRGILPSMYLVFALALTACATTGTRSAQTATAPTASAADIARIQDGLASWYSDSLAGRHTASGVAYDPALFTAAHRSLPFGTRLHVVRTDTGRAVDVVVNDRGPFGSARRILDLSRAAATELQMLSAGVVPVRIEVVALGNGARARRNR
jgi:rare lipoprotein A